MYKIISLDLYFENTQERRVTDITNSPHIKLASNEIQRYWINLEKDASKAYLHVIAMGAGEYYGSNSNGDYFSEKDLKTYHNTFVTNAYVYKHHVNKDPNKSYGKVLFSYYNDNMHRVELILEIDKAKSPEIVEAIKKGQDIAVSMGCKVDYDICSICGNKAKTRQEYCNHLKFNMNKILSDGRKVYAINPPPLKFFDISIVTKPADRTAWSLQKAASAIKNTNVNYNDNVISSAELGEQAELYNEKLAAIRKFSDIIKAIEGLPTEYKDDEQVINLLRNIDIDKLKNSYPVLPYEELDKIDDVDAITKVLFSFYPGAFSLGDLAYLLLRKSFGTNSYKFIPYLISMLPYTKPEVTDLDKSISFLLCDNFNNVNAVDELLPIVVPVINKRLDMLLNNNLIKVANNVYNYIPATAVQAPALSKNSTLVSRILSNINQTIVNSDGPANFDKVYVRDSEGNMYYSPRRQIVTTSLLNDKVEFTKKLTGLAALLASIAGVMYAPSLPLKLGIGATAGLLAGSLLLNNNTTKVVTQEGEEIPLNTTFYKVASYFKGIRLPVIAGTAVPAALGLDYLYNSKIKYKDNPYYREQLSTPGKIVDYLGSKVVESPLTSLVVGGIGGSLLSNIGREAKFLARRKYKK